mmetsp:Transcript_11120/g.31069  ORF Transcript_11120/g.31069 Transcript_11120/m.31069 type:complete len:85 (-) Transcript_11120:71-325(-)
MGFERGDLLRAFSRGERRGREEIECGFGVSPARPAERRLEISAPSRQSTLSVVPGCRNCVLEKRGRLHSLAWSHRRILSFLDRD